MGAAPTSNPDRLVYLARKSIGETLMISTTEMFTHPVQTWTRFLFKTSELIWSANKALFSQAARMGSGMMPAKLRPVVASVPVVEEAVLLKSAPLKSLAVKHKTTVKAKQPAKTTKKTRTTRSKAH
jgi:hypothetical protein